MVCTVVELCESGDLATQLRIRGQGGQLFAEEHLQVRWCGLNLR